MMEADATNLDATTAIDGPAQEENADAAERGPVGSKRAPDGLRIGEAAAYGDE